MRNDYETLFQSLPNADPPAGLLSKICARIQQKQTRSARVRLVFLGISTIFSCVALIFVSRYAFGEFSQSGFYEYLALATSDSAIILAYWQEFSFSLLESFPLFGVAAVFGTVLALLWLMQRVIKNMQVILYKTNY